MDSVARLSVLMLILLSGLAATNVTQNGMPVVPTSGSTLKKFLLKPGVLPPAIGWNYFDTLQQVSFPLESIFPSSARLITVSTRIFSIYAEKEADFTVWLWTECSGSVVDIKMKRGMRYAQTAASFDSETFDFVYCPSNPKLYFLSDTLGQQNMQIELWAGSYIEG